MTISDDDVSQLADIQRQLLDLPDDAFAERHALRKLQDVVRERARSTPVSYDDDRSTDELLAELSGLRSQVRQIEKQKIDLVVQAGGGAPGGSNMTNLGGVSLNHQIGQASGLPRIQARIGVLKSVIGGRGVEVPPSD